MAELQGTIECIDMRLVRGWRSLVVESDTKVAVQTLQTSEVILWQFRTSLRKIVQGVEATDYMVRRKLCCPHSRLAAKRGAGLLNTIITRWDLSSDPWLNRMKSPDEAYCRFSNM
ncbi:hypothetical protein FRX31_019359 [Thalictrum thalictroides]|uniref:Uncharacterized protein n=1 Tax=Thalictrum thalictroides TaxID=46969 RepID=A0A7J6W111_THATH|nr:hypothetical protein FRX31_019359 [Thalictrum thalictroides]